MSFKPCVDFDLAPLSKYPKDMFIHNDDVELNNLKNLVLTLSTIYNELKNITWFAQQLDNGRPNEMKIEPYCGQWSGMQWYVVKMLSSLCYEFMETLKKNRNVLTSNDVQKITKEMNEYHGKKAWESLLDYDSARASGSKEPFIKLLSFISKLRNNIGYHYYETKNFYEGYKYWVESDEASEQENVYASLGDTLELTRFYFGDVVNAGYIKAWEDKLGAGQSELKDFINKLSSALRFFIENSVEYVLKKNN